MDDDDLYVGSLGRMTYRSRFHSSISSFCVALSHTLRFSRCSFVGLMALTAPSLLFCATRAPAKGSDQTCGVRGGRRGVGVGISAVASRELCTSTAWISSTIGSLYCQEADRRHRLKRW